MKYRCLNIVSLGLVVWCVAIVKSEDKLPDLPPPCDSEIYCYGRIIDLVMRKSIFTDSKTFVDMKLKKLANETLAEFDKFLLTVNLQPTKEQLLNWVNENFDPLGSELESFKPVDHKSDFQLLHTIKDKELSKFAGDLNNIWLELSKKMKDEVREHPELTSIVYVPNPFIIAGGRFVEFYYWDSYWIIRGLLDCEMYQTARGMLENFLHIIDRYGFIPNGGRVYYSARSHPPLLSGMIKSYVDATHNYSFAITSIDALEREFEYFLNKTVIVRGHRMARYIDHSNGPRPESYREDIEMAEREFATEYERNEFYAEIKAGAESGWDFTSRWFINKTGGIEGGLKDIHARSIIPVELNAFLCWNARIISEFYGYAGNGEKQEKYLNYAGDFMKAVNEVLWNEEAGTWFDYDIMNNKTRPYFASTNLSPLFTECFNKSDSVRIAERTMNYIDKNELDKYPGGVPNTLLKTGEQWDFPNVWAPCVYFLVYGLENLNQPKTSELAFKWAQRWVQSNYKAFNETGAMYEKYIATEFGVSGSGGEYEVQKGFGWSNGAVLDFLDRYGDRLEATSGGSSRNLVNFAVLLSMVSAIVMRIFM